MFLLTIGNQLNRIEDIMETQGYTKNSFVKNDNKPLFKPFEFSKKFQENPHIDQTFIDKISQKVKDNLIIPETPQPSHRRICTITKGNGLIKSTNEYSSQNQNLTLNVLTIKDLQEEVKHYKKEIEDLSINRVGICPSNLSQEEFREIPKSSQDNNRKAETYLNTVSRVIFQKWEVYLTIVIKNKFVIDIIALIDSGAALNCLQEGLVPIQLYEKTKQNLFGANG